jgi:hypothetical protein
MPWPEFGRRRGSKKPEDGDLISDSHDIFRNHISDKGRVLLSSLSYQHRVYEQSRVS